MNGDPSDDVIPENTTLVTPVAPLPLSIILKFLFGLNSVDGDWKIPFMNRTPFPPLVPIPIVLAPPTLKVNDDFILQTKDNLFWAGEEGRDKTGKNLVELLNTLAKDHEISVRKSVAEEIEFQLNLNGEIIKYISE